jgi:ABC-2 type transport system permease protein
MNAVKIVFNQVFRKNLKSGGWWSIVLSPLVLGLIMFGIGYYMSSTTATPQVGVVASAPIQQGLMKQSSDSVKYRTYASQKSAEKALADKKIDGVLTVNAQTPYTSQYLSRQGGQEVSKNTLTANLSQLNTAAVAGELHLTSAQLTKLLTPPSVTTRNVSISDSGKMTAKGGAGESAKYLLAMAISVMFYGFLLSYGSMTAQEIATEKGSRIEEMILSAISARAQFFGKILGIMALMVVQIVLYAIIAGGVLIVGRNNATIRGILSQVDWSMLDATFIIMTLGFFVIGILSYTVLSALLGSLVASQEQASQATMPVVMLSLVGYMAALMSANGSTPLVNILSYIPFLSPLIMPSRLAVGQVSSPEALLALGINVAFLAIFTWLSAKLYETNVLAYSDNSIWHALRQSWTIARSERGRAKTVPAHEK